MGSAWRQCSFFFKIYSDWLLSRVESRESRELRSVNCFGGRFSGPSPSMSCPCNNLKETRLLGLLKLGCGFLQGVEYQAQHGGKGHMEVLEDESHLETAQATPQKLLEGMRTSLFPTFAWLPTWPEETNPLLSEATLLRFGDVRAWLKKHRLQAQRTCRPWQV